MRIKLAQLSINQDINDNVLKMVNVINSSTKNEWIIFPEGMLSGYYPENPDFIASINKDALGKAEEKIISAVINMRCYCIFGTVTFNNDKCFNSSIYITSSGKKQVYMKNNLSTLDRKHFCAGSNLDVFHSDEITFGIQMCRENAFPEQWKALKKKGAKIIFHINNSVREDDSVRRHLLISRAFENQIFVCSVNTIAEHGPLPSLLISPSGKILYEAPLYREEISSQDINLSKVSNVYLEQERTDLVDLKYQ